jgi:dephospho-CoA kinase
MAMTAAGEPVLRVGLTGNIGAGKSTVGEMLQERGCRVIDADRLGHLLLEAGSPVLRRVVEVFGDQILGPGGGADRGVLAEVVFSDPDARRRLETILHPAIRQLEEQEATDDPGLGIIVTEASLLVETGGHHRYHRLVVVTAPEGLRLQRLAARGLNAEQARRRTAAQMPEAEKARYADYLIDNAGTRDQTREQVVRLHAKLTDDLAALRRGDALPRSPSP